MKHTAMNKLKFLQLKNRLKLPTYQVVGILESLWVFTATNALDGGIGRFPDAGIAAFLEWPGDPGDLIAALVAEKWIDRREDEARLSVHDWHEHAPNFVKGALARHGKSFLAAPGAKPPAESQATLPGQPALGTTEDQGRLGNEIPPGQAAQGTLLEEPPLGGCPGMLPPNLTQPNLTPPLSPPAGGPQKNPSSALQEKPEQRLTRREAAAEARIAEVSELLPEALEASARAKWRDFVRHCASKGNPVSTQMAGELIPELAKLPDAEAVVTLAGWISAGRWSPPSDWRKASAKTESSMPPLPPGCVSTRRENGHVYTRDPAGAEYRLDHRGRVWVRSIEPPRAKVALAELAKNNTVSQAFQGVDQ